MAKKATAAKKENAPDKAAQGQGDKVTVRVVCAALGEDSATYLQGETFETSAERAAALGDSVQVI